MIVSILGNGIRLDQSGKEDPFAFLDVTFREGIQILLSNIFTSVITRQRTFQDTSIL